MQNIHDLITPEYTEQNRLLHEQCRAKGDPWGVSGRRYVDEVVKFAAETMCESILDYGCGSGTMKEGLKKILPIKVDEYDPAIPGKNIVHGDAYDMVVCTDVMEHVEPNKIDNVLQHISSLARKAVYLVIACNETQHFLPDGRSSHLTIKPPRWWVDRVGFLDWKIVQVVPHFKKVKIWIKK